MLFSEVDQVAREKWILIPPYTILYSKYSLKSGFFQSLAQTFSADT